MPTLPVPSSLLTTPAYGVVPTLREPQLALTQRVASAMQTRIPLLAEAGTGVGKTLAYVAPAVEMLLVDTNDYDEDEDEDEDEKIVRPPRTTVVIATATKALQAQIVSKELPRLAAGVVRRMREEGASEQEIRDALHAMRFAKKVGKKNYLCMRRVHDVSRVNPEFRKVHLPIYEDFAASVSGWVIDDAPEDRPLPDDAWRFGVGYCNPDRCKHADACEDRGYLFAKARAKNARIIVTNHALVTADLVLRRRELGNVLPDKVHTFVIDEAHRFADSVRDALTVEFTEERWASFASSYLQLRLELGAGPAQLSGWPATLPGVDNVRATCAAFVRDNSADKTSSVRDYRNALGTALDALFRATGAHNLETLRQASHESSERTPRGALLREVAEYAVALDIHWRAAELVLEPEKMRGTYVLYDGQDRDDAGAPKRYLVPVRVSGVWDAYLRETEAVPVYVSATLATGFGQTEAQRFDPFVQELALPPGREAVPGHVTTFITDSPFDYAKQALLYTPEGVDHTMADVDAYAAELVRVARPLLIANEGHAFILFTSRVKLAAFERALGASDYPYPILSQDSSEQVRKRGATLFKNTPNATLLGMRTFYEGVDIPGLALSLVIIPQLPVPALTASLAAKRAAAASGHQRTFNVVDVPIMLTDLRQMVGRLIRSVDDRGVVAILDKRVHTKAYARAAVAALGLPVVRTQEGPAVGLLRRISDRRAEQTAAASSAGANP